VERRAKKEGRVDLLTYISDKRSRQALVRESAGIGSARQWGVDSALV
jgi:hypothetical protein